MRFNILDFGAAGDGVTNDTPAVRAAMEAARDEAGDSTVLFPGGRTYRTGYVRVYSHTEVRLEEGSLWKAADSFDAFLPEDTDEILTGGAAGVDASVRAWAEEAGIPCREFLPDYERFGRSAPIRRNAEMLSEADLVLAFWDGKSPGTRFGIDDVEFVKEFMHRIP